MPSRCRKVISVISGNPISAVGSVTFDAVRQRHPKALNLGTAGAVIRLLQTQIVFDLLLAEVAKMYRSGDVRKLPAPAGGIQYAQGGVKHGASAAEAAQLCDRVGVIARLAHCMPAEVGDLIGCDDQGRGVGLGHRIGLGGRQA